MSATTAPDTEPRQHKATAIPHSQQMVLDVLTAAERNRLPPLAASQVRETLERLHAPRRFDKGWVTARLDELRDRDLVETTGEHRLDPITRRLSDTWRLRQVVQARVFA